MVKQVGLLAHYSDQPRIRTADSLHVQRGSFEVPELRGVKLSSRCANFLSLKACIAGFSR